MPKDDMNITVTLKNQDGKVAKANQFNDDERKHLEFIEATISRMAGNSLKIKGLSVTLTTAFIALVKDLENPMMCLSIIFPIFALGFLDAYYLRFERKFRGVYSSVINRDGKVKPYGMPINKYTSGKYSFCSCLKSGSVLLFYLALIATSIFATLVWETNKDIIYLFVFSLLLILGLAVEIVFYGSNYEK